LIFALNSSLARYKRLKNFALLVDLIGQEKKHSKKMTIPVARVKAVW
jgi:hypothetical protein